MAVSRNNRRDYGTGLACIARRFWFCSQFARKVIMAGVGRETARRLGLEQRFAHAPQALLRLSRSVLTNRQAQARTEQKFGSGWLDWKLLWGPSYVVINGKANKKRNLKLNKTTRWRGKSNCIFALTSLYALKKFHTCFTLISKLSKKIKLQSINQSSFIHTITSLKNAF